MRLNFLHLLRSGQLYHCSLQHQKTISILPVNSPTSTTRRFICTTKPVYKFVPTKDKVPTLNEADIEEQFVSGSGPGGQNVNRLQNCVVLRHIPTGIVVKCHQDRLMQRNRKLARQLLIDRLDQHYNGEDSVAEQKKRYILSKKADRDQKAADLRALKKQYQESLKQKRSDESASEVEVDQLKN